MKPTFSPLLTTVMLALPLTANAGIIIGHADVDGVAALPQSIMDAVGRQRWLFAHASVGGNMIEGMQSLHGDNPGRYPLAVDTYGDWSSIAPPPASTVPGTIYDAPRGNPGWQAKFTMLDEAVRTLGWHEPKVNVVMDKLCYIDQDANPTNYVAMMTALERDFPGTVFVYTTMPLESSANSDNILRTGYNNYVRAHCLTNSRTLFDIADIESHDPAGNPITFTNESKVYQRMYDGYTTDGGHLNATGEQRVALGWYATAVALTDRLQTIRLVATQNAQLDAGAPDTPFQDWGVMDVFSYNGPSSLRRVLLQFDLAAIPPGAILTSARLGICSRAPMNYEYTSAQEVWRVENDAWQQGTVTWNNFASGPSNHLAGLTGGVGQHYSIWNLDLSVWNSEADLADDRLSLLVKYPASQEGDYYFRGLGYYSRAVPNANNGSGQPDADIVPYLEIAYTGNPPAISPPLIQVQAPANTLLTLAWPTFPGWRYQLQANAALETTNWTAVTGTNYASERFMTNLIVPDTNQRRFFRVQQFSR